MFSNVNQQNFFVSVQMSLRGAFFATKQSPRRNAGITLLGIASQKPLAMTNWAERLHFFFAGLRMLDKLKYNAAIVLDGASPQARQFAFQLVRFELWVEWVSRKRIKRIGNPFMPLGMTTHCA
ncbi:hypothetical protein ANRL3_01316 [Anaerolineae bacterium]|nr:hypothetical protein ANRL3_01316 [Anaerolineae bacterium]